MIKRIIFFITVLLSFQAFSQRTSSSPYSFFGVGEEFGTQTVEQITMGGIGAAYSTPYHLNLTNPASLADLRFSTYAFGLLNNDLRIRDADTDQRTSTTTLSYFSVGIPISPRIGVIAGMQPTSAVGYSLINTIEDADGRVLDLTQFAGTGSVNRLYGGFGFRIYKGFSIGMEVDFLFGNVQNSVLNLRDNVALATRNVEDSNIRGGSIKIGAQYKEQLKDDMHVNAGAVVTLGNTLKATGREDLFSLTADLGVDFPRDTIFSADLNGRFKRPLETTIGVGVGKNNKWYAEVDYSFRDAYQATGYLNEAAESFAYTNASRISFGGFFIPKYNSISSYWQRVTFRAGVRYERTGLLANGIPGGTTFTNINDFGISFGLGLPIGKQYPSNLNFAVEYGQKGTQDNGLLQENYLNLRLSLSLNDRWFKKRRID